MTKVAVDFKYLWLEQVLQIRKSWYWFLIFSLLLPLAMIFGFSRMGGDPTPARLLYIVTGAAIFSATNDALYQIAQRVVTMRRSGVLLYYMSLPISKMSFVIAMTLSRIVFMLPGVIIPLMVGQISYHLGFQFNIWLVILI